MRRRFGFISVLLLTHFFSLFAVAAPSEFYTVKDLAPVEVKMDPMLALYQGGEVVVDELLNLLSWQEHKEALPTPTEPYNRLNHYGTWVVDPMAGDCLNTRARVLVRQSETPVTYSQSGCTVIAGQWHDPYTNQNFTRASDLDIDHVVPLKNSYVSGAWEWDKKKRCLYANFMANDFHLLAVRSDDNRKKGDSGPDRFMPTNTAYACDYLAIWLKIKLIWNLAMTVDEADAIARLARDNSCSPKTLSLDALDLQQQRRAILSRQDLCN